MVIFVVCWIEGIIIKKKKDGEERSENFLLQFPFHSQEIHVRLHAVKGIGRDHAKFSPVGKRGQLALILICEDEEMHAGVGCYLFCSLFYDVCSWWLSLNNRGGQCSKLTRRWSGRLMIGPGRETQSSDKSRVCYIDQSEKFLDLGTLTWGGADLWVQWCLHAISRDFEVGKSWSYVWLNAGLTAKVRV